MLLFQYHTSLRNIILLWGFIHIGIYLIRLPNYIFCSSENAKIFSNLTGVMGDIIKNILNIRILNSKRFEENYFSLKQEVDIRSYRKALGYDKATCVLMDLGAYLPVLNTLFIYKLLELALLKEISISEALVVFNIARSVASQVWKTTIGIGDILIDITRFQEGLQILNLQNQVLDQFPDNPIKTDTFDGSVEFVDVNFFYQQEDALLFDALNLKIAGRTKVALVGSSGSGKSTIISLLMRINEPMKGKILINGQDIKSVSRSSISKTIAFVSQSSFLFQRTIFENIGYGSEEFREYMFNKTNKNLKFYNLPKDLQSAIIEAAKKAEAHSFILNLPNGYDSKYGNEINLSGGQVQRLNIARAFINKEAQILVLDEATSALDSESDSLIKKILDKMDITIIMVAHKLNMIKDFDRILVFSEGKIIEDGSHEELMNLGGKYYTLTSSFDR
jgi:ATP-binding cassette subfamily B protein